LLSPRDHRPVGAGRAVPRAPGGGVGAVLSSSVRIRP